jgi:peptide/nickel transport system substrate-binding protein
MAWGALVSRINKYPPDPGGWNIFATYSTGGVMHHPLMNIFANTACDRKNAAGWPCDEEALKHRNAYLGSRSEAEKRRNLEAFHRRLWESAVYVNAGQFDAPFAWRSNLDGVTPVALPVFWNIAKK